MILYVKIEWTSRIKYGLILYFRNLIKSKRRHEYEIFKIETIWAEIELPNTKPFWFVQFTIRQVYTVT